MPDGSAPGGAPGDPGRGRRAAAVVELLDGVLRAHGRELAGERVGVLAVTDGPDEADSSPSGAGAVLALLARRGAETRYHDPAVPVLRDDAGAEHRSVGIDALIHWTDALVILGMQPAVEWAHAFREPLIGVDATGAGTPVAPAPGSDIRRLSRSPTGT